MENGKITKLVLNPNATIFYPTPILGNKLTHVKSKINTLCLDPNAMIWHSSTSGPSLNITTYRTAK